MGNLLKNLWKHKASVLVIILLLVLQAYCELSLPNYTADIVDVGIEQGGIDSPAPKEMTEETYENISLFMTDEEVEILGDSYTEDKDGVYVRKELEDEELTTLEDDISVPMVMVYFLEHASDNGEGASEYTAMIGGDAGGEISMDQMKMAVEAGMMDQSQLLEMRDTAMDKLGDLSDTMIAQMSVLMVQQEYETLGYDMDDFQQQYLLQTGGKMILMTIIMMMAAILVGFFASKTAAGIGRDLRENVYSRVIDFSSKEMDQFSTASLITRCTNDIQQVQMVSVMLLRMVLYAPILAIGGIYQVAQTRTGMSWIIVVAVAAIVCIVVVLMGVMLPKFKIMQSLVDRLNLVSREILTGIPVIRAFSREKHEEKRFDEANTDLMKTQLFTNRLMSCMMPIMMLIMNGITVAIVWFGSKNIDAGHLQVGDMMAFITYTMVIIMGFLMITMISIMLPRAGVAADRIQEVIDTKTTVVDKDVVRDDELADVAGVLEFDDVSFRYPNAKTDVLEHLSFTARPGETTAIIGSTGCGKSTLLNLIPRLYDVTEGKITLDGIDIRDLSQEKLRAYIGYVPQKAVLFSGDVESNIKYANDDISDEMMEKAAEISQSLEFIDEKNDKYESVISQGGSNVSGGQKQRLSIARAIAKNPKLYLFDDSFSALDFKTDKALREALDEYTRDTTILIVAQRISTILHAQQIIVLDDGKIVGIGTHSELLNSCEAYQEIASSQLSEKEIAETREAAVKGGAL